MKTSDTKIIDFSASAPKSSTPSQQAAEWVAYLYADDVTSEGKQKFSEWYAQSAENRTAFNHIEKSWDILDYAIVSDGELDAELAGIIQKKRSFSLKSSPLKAIAAIAASIIITVGVWTAILQVTGPAENQIYATQIGKIKTITLADGSKITLAGATRLVTHFSDAVREVELSEGQAYFDVMRDTTRPFLIRAGDTEVRVLGTEFDIQKTSSDVRISVTEGVVDVADVINPSVKLTIGEQIHVSTDGSRSAITPFKKSSLLAWREGRLEYNNDPLSRVIDEVNRYRSIKITLADASLADMPVSIAFSTHQTDHLFDGLELTGMVDVIRTPEAVTIQSK